MKDTAVITDTEDLFSNSYLRRNSHHFIMSIILVFSLGYSSTNYLHHFLLVRMVHELQGYHQYLSLLVVQVHQWHQVLPENRQMIIFCYWSVLTAIQEYSHVHQALRGNLGFPVDLGYPKTSIEG